MGTTRRTRNETCPCGSGRDYDVCCGRYLDQNLPAPDCEALMRSRYTAFAMARSDYLLATWHAETRPRRLDLEQQPRSKWLGLKIVAVQQEPPTVEFVARCRIAGKAYRLHERSRFVREDGAWLYYDGIQDPEL